MKQLALALRIEWFVALRTISHKLILTAPATVAFIQYLLIRLGDAGRMARDSLLGVSDFEEVVANNAWGYFADGVNTGLTILALVLVAQAAYSFSFERDTGSVRQLLVRGISRPVLLTAKFLHLLIWAAMAVLLLLLVAYLTSGWFWEYGSVVEDGFELINEQEIQQELALGIRLALFPLPATIALGLLISVLAQSATQAVTTALGITLALDFFKVTLGDSANYVYTSFQPALLNQSYLQDVSRLVRGYSDVLIDERFLQLNQWVPWPTLALLLVGGLVLVQYRKL